MHFISSKIRFIYLSIFFYISKKARKETEEVFIHAIKKRMENVKYDSMIDETFRSVVGMLTILDLLFCWM